MRKNDMALIYLQDIAVAMVLLTRLPLPALPDDAFKRQANATWAFPLVGSVVALIAGGVGVGLLALGLPAAAAAGILLAVQIVVTGAMHEDGLADCVDGLWGGFDRERRLEIMKDSAIGTYGVLALILSVGLRWLALSTLLPLGIGGVLTAAILSRAILPIMMTSLPNARRSGLSHSVGMPNTLPSVIALATGVALAIGLLGSNVILPMVVAYCCVFALGRIALAKIGGQTGDILGAAQQIAEGIVLLGLAALVGQSF
jgi:adenosylcobinamide-GDP ribazoletransferase